MRYMYRNNSNTTRLRFTEIPLRVYAIGFLCDSTISKNFLHSMNVADENIKWIKLSEKEEYYIFTGDLKIKDERCERGLIILNTEVGTRIFIPEKEIEAEVSKRKSRGERSSTKTSKSKRSKRKSRRRKSSSNK